ncbi:MAG: hypothetical protein Ta2E_00640 [Mycoplasmoidaceae bacterium]|nr:MAG: hypothetical protein Ta2E_00640 [Mycoplasmoidaceae bacterium]
MVYCSMDLKTIYKDSYLKTLKPSGTSQWNLDLADYMWIMNLPDENSCAHKFTRIGKEFIMPCGWDYGGVQGQRSSSTAYQWNLVIKPYSCKVPVPHCSLHPLQTVMQCYNLINPSI